MCNPPKEKERPICTDLYVEAYDAGYVDANKGVEYRADELYEPSHHERDTTFEDELNYCYYCGYGDFDRKEDE